MASLKQEISSFLRERGLEVRECLCGGTALLSATVGGASSRGGGADSDAGGVGVDGTGGWERLIMPLPVVARTLAEAAAVQENISSILTGFSIENGGAGKECPDTYGGIRPLIITEDRWRHDFDCTSKRLLAHLEIFHTVYARNCEIRRIDKGTAADFLGRCHSYGDAACKYRYGMFLKRYTGHSARLPGAAPVSGGEEGAFHGEVQVVDRRLPAGTLVAVAEFSGARRWLKVDKSIRSHEWTRYASLPDVRVAGGMGRILQHFIREVSPDDIMTYADMEWSEGQAYRQLGFEEEALKTPVDFIVDPRTWERQALRTAEDAARAASGDSLIFRNFGSKKFRLKLTEY